VAEVGDAEIGPLMPNTAIWKLSPGSTAADAIFQASALRTPGIAVIRPMA
jgi:hypothetical protein